MFVCNACWDVCCALRAPCYVRPSPQYYEENRLDRSAPKLLCRIENFTQYNPGLDFLLTGDKLVSGNVTNHCARVRCIACAPLLRVHVTS